MKVFQPDGSISTMVLSKLNSSLSSNDYKTATTILKQLHKAFHQYTKFDSLKVKPCQLQSVILASLKSNDTSVLKNIFCILSVILCRKDFQQHFHKIKGDFELLKLFNSNIHKNLKLQICKIIGQQSTFKKSCLFNYENAVSSDVLNFLNQYKAEEEMVQVAMKTIRSLTSNGYDQYKILQKNGLKDICTIGLISNNRMTVKITMSTIQHYCQWPTPYFFNQLFEGTRNLAAFESLYATFMDSEIRQTILKICLLVFFYNSSSLNAKEYKHSIKVKDYLCMAGLPMMIIVALKGNSGEERKHILALCDFCRLDKDWKKFSYNVLPIYHERTWSQIICHGGVELFVNLIFKYQSDPELLENLLQMLLSVEYLHSSKVQVFQYLRNHLVPILSEIFEKATKQLTESNKFKSSYVCDHKMTSLHLKNCELSSDNTLQLSTDSALQLSDIALQLPDNSLQLSDNALQSPDNVLQLSSSNVFQLQNENNVMMESRIFNSTSEILNHSPKEGPSHDLESLNRSKFNADVKASLEEKNNVLKSNILSPTHNILDAEIIQSTLQASTVSNSLLRFQTQNNYPNVSAMNQTNNPDILNSIPIDNDLDDLILDKSKILTEKSKITAKKYETMADEAETAAELHKKVAEKFETMGESSKIVMENEAVSENLKTMYKNLNKIKFRTGKRKSSLYKSSEVETEPKLKQSATISENQSRSQDESKSNKNMDSNSSYKSVLLAIVRLLPKIVSIKESDVTSICKMFLPKLFDCMYFEFVDVNSCMKFFIAIACNSSSIQWFFDNEFLPKIAVEFVNKCNDKSCPKNRYNRKLAKEFFSQLRRFFNHFHQYGRCEIVNRINPAKPDSIKYSCVISSTFVIKCPKLLHRLLKEFKAIDYFIEILHKSDKRMVLNGMCSLVAVLKHLMNEFCLKSKFICILCESHSKKILESSESCWSLKHANNATKTSDMVYKKYCEQLLNVTNPNLNYKKVFNCFLDQEKNIDCQFKFDNGVIGANKEKLCDRNEVLKMMLEGSFSEAKGGVIEINSVSFECMRILIHFIYGCSDCEVFDTKNIDNYTELLYISDMYFIPELKVLAIHHLSVLQPIDDLFLFLSEHSQILNPASKQHLIAAILRWKFPPISVDDFLSTFMNLEAKQNIIHDFISGVSTLLNLTKYLCNCDKFRRNFS